MEHLNSPLALTRLRSSLRDLHAAKPHTFAVCAGTGCLAADGKGLGDLFVDELSAQGLLDKVGVRQTGCHGFCERGPVVICLPEGIAYFQVRPNDIPEIVATSISGQEPVTRLLYQDPDSGERIPLLDDIPFYGRQRRILLDKHLLLDARSIHDYIAIGGYASAAKSLCETAPEEVIRVVKASGLRGRGGGGFPTGRKWESTRKASGTTRYVIANGDEGDPGAYMDRSLMEGNPHAILEGMLIGGYAIGASSGTVYVRQEYPLALENLERAIQQAREIGLLGANILGSGFDFDLSLHRGAGAFVSGESTALINAIEGRVGEPRPKYVHTVDTGLWGCPTCLNNVETWANIPQIIEHGDSWFGAMGTAGSKGTKVFSLVGNVRNTGLVEVPMGITLRELVEEIGGGAPGGKVVKAVQIGGPSGGVIPAESLDLPVDFDALTGAGAMMGSGGIIVLDEDACMVNTAQHYLHFLSQESCGKCIPCREGTRQLVRIVDAIAGGRAVDGDLETLEEVASFMEDASLCALGKTAANPVLSVLRYFREEVECHVREHRCPAGVCPDLITYWIDPATCEGCALCAKHCPTNAVVEISKGQFRIDSSMCVKCGVCVDQCPSRFSAIRKVPVQGDQTASDTSVDGS
ncbi:MAG: NADH-ubiquinone oxidoreductase-F iron-sulfur binding region domain-containing protein [Pseudomonadota bacterium]